MWRSCAGDEPAAVQGVHAVWQVSNSSVQVRRGDEFSLTCVVTSLTQFDVVRLTLGRPASEFRGEIRLQRPPGTHDARFKTGTSKR